MPSIFPSYTLHHPCISPSFHLHLHEGSFIWPSFPWRIPPYRPPPIFHFKKRAKNGVDEQNKSLGSVVNWKMIDYFFAPQTAPIIHIIFQIKPRFDVFGERFFERIRCRRWDSYCSMPAPISRCSDRVRHFIFCILQYSIFFFLVVQVLLLKLDWVCVQTSSTKSSQDSRSNSPRQALPCIAWASPRSSRNKIFFSIVIWHTRVRFIFSCFRMLCSHWMSGIFHDSDLTQQPSFSMQSAIILDHL